MRRRFQLLWPDYVGWDAIEGGWFFYVGSLFVRWSRCRP
jgi:hypothetical protein